MGLWKKEKGVTMPDCFPGSWSPPGTSLSCFVIVKLECETHASKPFGSALTVPCTHSSGWRNVLPRNCLLARQQPDRASPPVKFQCPCSTGGAAHRGFSLAGKTQLRWAAHGALCSAECSEQCSFQSPAERREEMS